MISLWRKVSPVRSVHSQKHDCLWDGAHRTELRDSGTVPPALTGLVGGPLIVTDEVAEDGPTLDEPLGEVSGRVAGVGLRLAAYQHHCRRPYWRLLMRCHSQEPGVVTGAGSVAWPGRCVRRFLTGSMGTRLGRRRSGQIPWSACRPERRIR